ncbi:hypothetical protein ACWD4G_36755 [Streptomyces sp. NPDC002643]
MRRAGPTTGALGARYQAGTWLAARALGYRLVFDYRRDQLSIQAGTAGAQLTEGTWYCPRPPLSSDHRHQRPPP